MDLLNSLLETCTALTRKVKNLEQDKIAQALEIIKLKKRVRKLEKKRKLTVIGLKRLKKVGTTQKIESSADTVMDDQEDAYKQEVEKNTDVQRRLEESQAKVYHIDLEHADKVLKVVTAATTIITAAASITAATITATPSAARRRKGVVIKDPKETATPSTIVYSEPKSKDKRKGIIVEEPKPLKKQAQIEQDEAYARELEAELNRNINWDDVIEQVKENGKQDNAVLRYQALNRKPQTKAQARKNMMVYLKNMAGFKMEYFKGMSYNDIRPIFEKYFNSNVAFLEKKNNKPHYKIIRADGTHQLFLSFLSLLRNFDKKDLEMLWQIVNERFASSKPKNFSDDFMLTTLTYMFKKPDVEAQVWKNQKIVHDDLAGREKISIDKVHFGSDAKQYFKQYTLKDYYCWLKTYNCWCKLMLLDDAADIKLRLLEQSTDAVQLVSVVQIVKTVSIRVTTDFLNAHTIKYALVVNHTIYVSCIKQFWATAIVKKINDNVQLRALIDGKKVVVSGAIIQRDLHLDYADRVEYLPNEEIFKELARMGYENPPSKLTFYKAFFSAQWKFLTHTLHVRNVDSSSKFLMYPRFLQVVIDNQVDDMTSHNTRYTSLALTHKDPTPTPHATPPQDQPSTPHASLPQEQPTATSKSSMSLLTTLMETCATLSQKVAELEQHKHSQDLKILQLKRGGKIAAIDADEDITLVDMEKDEEVVAMDAEPQGRINQEDVNAATKGVSAAKPSVFDDEEVQERHLENIKKYQNRKKKLVSIPQARKNMIIYLKNMAGYKMEHFKGMTYDKVRPIFEREYKKVQTFFKPDKDVEEPKKKRVADETLLQESFKKLRAAEVSVSEFKVEALQVKYPIIDWEICTECLRYWEIIRVGGITEAYQSFKDMLKGFDREDLVELKRLFEPYADDVLWKLQRYMHAPLTWKLYTDCGVHHVSSTKEHDIFMLIEKDYPLSNAVMILMVSGKLQVEEDNEMARDLVMKIFM
uniref:Uncharacterized protein n=1 Tax=Tanacetum cinerariifolium TaxID=118510 RepID=A0A699GMT8_TANCI|nr:hypothetical protein [Tanacetum cinerariifolium]